MPADPPSNPAHLLPLSRTYIAVVWADDAPYARVIDDDSTSSSLKPLIGIDLNYQADSSSPRRCIGHTPFRDRSSYVDCNNPPDAPGRKCTRCTIVDATFASNLHHAHTRGRSELDASVVAHLGQENKLYLAGFRDGSVKIGTSTATRGHLRLLEQGAWSARFVATATDGYAVREIEDRVTSELEIPQAVSTSRKLDGLVRPIPDEQLDEKLGALGRAVAALVDQHADPRLSVCDEPWHRPGSDDAELWTGLHRYPLKLVAASHDFRIIGACGRIAVVTRPSSDDRFAVDLQPLFGVRLTLGDFDSDEIAIQDALF